MNRTSTGRSSMSATHTDTDASVISDRAGGKKISLHFKNVSKCKHLKSNTKKIKGYKVTKQKSEVMHLQHDTFKRKTDMKHKKKISVLHICPIDS